MSVSTWPFLLDLARREACSLLLFSSAGTIIVRIAYGYQAQHKEDPVVVLAEAAMRHFNRLRDPGLYLVDFIPLCILKRSLTT
jgi:hypothetical protein